MTTTTAPITAVPTGTVARTLLGCGVAAGPLFVGVALVQVLTRDGFDLTRHPLSLLSLGDLGWIQIANFVVGGLLTIAAAVGMRRVMPTGPGRTWGPRLIGAYGVGLVAGGVFVADPGLGFPAGAPAGMAEEFSWHGAIHAIAPPVAFLALVVACFVFARRYAAARQWGWAAYTAASGVAVIAVMAWPDPDTMSVRLAVAIAIGWAWASATALHLRNTTRR